MTSQSNIEIVVHVDETLDPGARMAFSKKMTEHTGVAQAEFCPSREHLLLVQYDREQLTSLDVLHYARDQGIHAELVGPV